MGEDAQALVTHNAWTIAGIALLVALLLVAAVRWNDRLRSKTSAE